MKKSYSKVLVAGAMATALSVAANAQAAVSLDDGTGLNTYATEIAGLVKFNDEISAKSKVVLPGTAAPVVKLSCSSAFTVLTPALSVTGAWVGATTALASGGVPAKYITLNVTPPVAVPPAVTGSLLEVDVWSWGAAPGPGSQFDVTSGAVVSCTYEVFETLGHYSLGTAMESTTGAILNWGSGLLLRAGDTTCEGVGGCSAGNYATIDLTAGGMKFTGNKTQGIIASVNLNVRSAATDTVYDKDGVALVWTSGATDPVVDATTEDTNMVVSGDFSAYDKVWYELGGTCNSYAATSAPTMNADKTMATFSNKQIKAAWGVNDIDGRGANTGSGVICASVDGATVMEASSYTAVVNLKAGGGFNVPASTELGMVGNVGDNGSRDDLQLVLTPGGAYAGFIRISHLGPDAGDVSLTVINDNGDKVVVKLGDIAGQSTSTLAAMASTTQMSVSDIYAAAQAADASFVTTGDNKLRIIVKSTSTTNVNASMYSLSKDGNSFALIQE